MQTLTEAKTSYLNSTTELGMFKFKPLQCFDALVLLVMPPAAEGFQRDGVRLQQTFSEIL